MASKKKKQDHKDALGLVLALMLGIAVFFVVFMFVTGYVNNRYGNYTVPDIPEIQEETEVETPLTAAELVLVLDGDGSLSKVFMTETDCMNLRWRMSTIPLDTRLELSLSLYKECVKANVAAPQFTTIAELFRCFEGDTASRLTFDAVRELLPFEPDFLTVMPKDVYLSVFEARDDKSPSRFSEALADNIKRAGSLYSFVKNARSVCKGRKTAEAELFYLETYENISNRQTEFRIIPGERHGNGYKVIALPADFYKK